MSIEDIEDFCEVCGKVVHVNRHGYNAHQGGCKCERLKVKFIRELTHCYDWTANVYMAKWLLLREKPCKGETFNVDGINYPVVEIEHVADSICALTIWTSEDRRTFDVNLGRHNITEPPRGMIDKSIELAVAEYEAAKWWRTDIWWRKKR